MLSRIAVFVSGGGTNLQALLDAQQAGKLPSGEIALVVASRSDAYALTRAADRGIPSEVVRRKDFEDQATYEDALTSLMRENKIDLIVLAGFMSILSKAFTDRFPQENFMIYDETHQLVAVHRAGKNYMLVDASDINTELLQNYSENEARFQKLWLAFFDSIAIEARTNPELQAQNIPKRFWKDAVELRYFCE